MFNRERGSLYTTNKKRRRRRNNGKRGKEVNMKEVGGEDGGEVVWGLPMGRWGEKPRKVVFVSSTSFGLRSIRHVRYKGIS